MADKQAEDVTPHQTTEESPETAPGAPEATSDEGPKSGPEEHAGQQKVTEETPNTTSGAPKATSSEAPKSGAEETPEVSPQKPGDIVIIAMDGSDYSEYALKFYAEELHKPGDHVILAHSTEYKTKSYPAVSIMSGDPAMMQSEIQADEKITDTLVDKLTEELDKLKVSGSIERLHGDPGHAIVKLAEQKQASYIVIGSRGKGTIRRTLTGSVTDFVVHHSHLPVLVARHKDHLHHHHHHHFHLNPFHHSHKHHHGNHDKHHDKHDKHKDDGSN